ncbi:hypothetical protein LGH70_02955 [Hymenobacter sp. BT635]|uniref:YtxH domain-containing protein n=1 Tax=Hymenobacter nitidus TaxID=2880929 RepID=A0ABS8A7Z1_9BACT|nr:hypothetical protein [Hymenobacter nitidus]MCB2376523.1 hypothetical protein [Hymenobacter nitidus]
MGKHKKKHSKKDQVSDDVLDAAALAIRKYRKVTNEIAKLSTGQKLVGGAILAAAGYFYLDKLSADWLDSQLPGLRALLPGAAKAEATPEDAGDDESERPAAARKSRKGPKRSKAHRPPAAAPDEDE